MESQRWTGNQRLWRMAVNFVKESNGVTRSWGGARAARWRPQGQPVQCEGTPEAGGLEAEPEAGHLFLADPMVPQSPRRVRGDPKNTHQGGAGGWENLQVVCVWPQQEAALLWCLPLLPTHRPIPTQVQGTGDPHGRTLYLRDHPEAPVLRGHPQEWAGAEAEVGSPLGGDCRCPTQEGITPGTPVPVAGLWGTCSRNLRVPI